MAELSSVAAAECGEEKEIAFRVLRQKRRKRRRTTPRPSGAHYRGKAARVLAYFRLTANKGSLFPLAAVISGV